jgi:hypothetical protein
MSVTMISRLMLRLHRNVASTSRNYSVSTTDFGSVLSANMIFSARLATNDPAILESETLANMELNGERYRSAAVLLLAEGENEYEMDTRR